MHFVASEADNALIPHLPLPQDRGSVAIEFQSSGISTSFVRNLPGAIGVACQQRRAAWSGHCRIYPLITICPVLIIEIKGHVYSVTTTDMSLSTVAVSRRQEADVPEYTGECERVKIFSRILRRLIVFRRRFCCASGALGTLACISHNLAKDSLHGEGASKGADRVQG